MSYYLYDSTLRNLDISPKEFDALQRVRHHDSRYEITIVVESTAFYGWADANGFELKNNRILVPVDGLYAPYIVCGTYDFGPTDDTTQISFTVWE